MSLMVSSGGLTERKMKERLKKWKKQIAKCRGQPPHEKLTLTLQIYIALRS